MSPGIEDTFDPDFLQAAAKYVIRTRDASLTGLTRRFHIGAHKAARLLQVLENHGAVGPRQEGRPRDILIESRQLQQLLDSLPEVGEGQ